MNRNHFLSIILTSLLGICVGILIGWAEDGEETSKQALEAIHERLDTQELTLTKKTESKNQHRKRFRLDSARRIHCSRGLSQQ